MSHEDYIISVYCVVDDYLKKMVYAPLRKRGFAPKLSDAEVISMELVGEFFEIDTDKGIWKYFKEHWSALFPHCGSRSNFVKQASNLWRIKQLIHEELILAMKATTDSLHMADGFPLPTCHFKRAYGSKLFKDVASYGYCASKDETYFGFKGNLAISSQGIITGITATAANVDERQSLWDIISNVPSGLLFADKGLNGQYLQAELLQETGINLQTPKKANQVDTRGKDASPWLTSTRRLVETVIGQLVQRFNIEKVRARDVWHLTSRISRKVLSHTVAVFINKQLGNKPLQFDRLISV